MKKILIIIPVLMMLVMGCSEETTPKFDSSNRYIPQSYTPTPEKGTSTGTVNYSNKNNTELTELERIIELEKANILLQKCLRDMYSVISDNVNHEHSNSAFGSISQKSNLRNLNASFSLGDCSNWNKNTGGN